MDKISLFGNSIKTIFNVLIIFGMATIVSAKENGCWVDVYENTQYRGKHFIFKGPAEIAYLNNENGENWEARIRSLKVGPTAAVTVYENRYFKLKPTEKPFSAEMAHSWGITDQDIKEDSELIFNADAMVHDLNDFKFERKIKSLKINCTD